MRVPRVPTAAFGRAQQAALASSRYVGRGRRGKTQVRASVETGVFTEVSPHAGVQSGAITMGTAGLFNKRSPDPKIQTNSAGKLRLWKVSVKTQGAPCPSDRPQSYGRSQVTFTILFSQDFGGFTGGPSPQPRLQKQLLGWVPLAGPKYAADLSRAKRPSLRPGFPTTNKGVSYLCSVYMEFDRDTSCRDLEGSYNCLFLHVRMNKNEAQAYAHSARATLAPPGGWDGALLAPILNL